MSKIGLLAGREGEEEAGDKERRMEGEMRPGEFAMGERGGGEGREKRLFFPPTLSFVLVYSHFFSWLRRARG